MWIGKMLFYTRWLSKESTCNAGDTGDAGSIPELGRSLGKGMTSQSSVLAWEIPWIEKPGGLQSMGSQRVRHNLPTKHSTHTTLVLHCQVFPV